MTKREEATPPGSEVPSELSQKSVVSEDRLPIPYYADNQATIYEGDSLHILAQLPDDSADAVCTDPPYGLEFMGKDWDRFGRDTGNGYQEKPRMNNGAGLGGYKERPNFYTAGRPFQAWCEAWAAECLRILKPGGHLLAFGGTRTSHRLACAVEDAGFEIRDSIAWLYGSGFPKSLDVSKAIDRQRTEDLAPVDAVRSWLNQRRLDAGLSHDAVNKHFGHASNGGGSSSAWMTNPTSRSLPTWDQWLALKALFGFADDMDAEVWRLNGRKGKPGDNWDSREVIGKGAAGLGGGSNGAAYEGGFKVDYDLTAPATPEAEQWQGWGTALKPAWEVVISAQKPLSDKDILDRIGSWLAQAADPKTRIGAAVASNDQTATSRSASVTSMNSNTVSSWRRCWAELYEATSTSTTETTSRTTTDLRTLLSCLEQITPESITREPSTPDGPSSLVELADNLFAAAVLNLRVTRTLTATATATKPTRPTSPEEAALSQVVLARKPLSAGTVAANVLRWGTGALNIDAGRIEHDAASAKWVGKWAGTEYETEYEGWGNKGKKLGGSPAGRWPANVALDESQAAELDQQSGEASYNPGATFGSSSGGTIYGAGAGLPAGRDVFGYGDRGGASRFFYTAKASSDERITHTGTAHPTVKPLSLMRWLVRLVTPPGGVILEPFAGSGSTVEAALLEGFRCIAIEREADYLPLITQRINRRRNPIAYLTAAGEDLGLFGDEGEAPSQPQGRWPANVVLDRSQAAALDQMSGERASSIWPEGGKSSGGLLNGTEEKRTEPTGYADTGGASRFFKVVDDDLGDGAA